MRLKLICCLSFIISIFFGSTSNADENMNNYRCLSGLNKYFAPYVNLPEYAGEFENFQIRSQTTVGEFGPTSNTAYVWPAGRSKNSDTKEQYIATAKGSYFCTYPSDLESRDLVIDEDAIKNGETSILKRNRSLFPRKGITCIKTQSFPRQIFEKYISWSPQLYEEFIQDKQSSANFESVSENYNPGNVMLNGLESCKSIHYAAFKEPINQKRSRFASAWDRLVTNGQGQSGEHISTGAVD